MNSTPTWLGARPIELKMWISRRRSNTEPSIVFSTISAAIRIGIARSPTPLIEVLAIEE